MNLEVIYQLGDVRAVISREITPIAKSVRTCKSKQTANANQQKADKMPDKFMRIAAIEARKDKKRNFFNKHKN